MASSNQENAGNSRLVSASLQPPKSFGLSASQQGLALRESKKNALNIAVHGPSLNQSTLGFLKEQQPIGNKRIQKMVHKENANKIIQSRKFEPLGKYLCPFLTKLSQKDSI